MDKRTLLIAGIPRSGTTWIARVLSSGRDTRLLMEPDNEKNSPAAWSLKRDVHRFPMITPGSTSRLYENLWRAIDKNGIRSFSARLIYLAFFRHRQAALEDYIQLKTGSVKSKNKASSSAGEYFSPTNNPLLDQMVKKMAVGKYWLSQPGKLIVKSVHSVLSVDWISSMVPVQVLIVLRNPYSIYASQKRLRMPDSSRNLSSQSSFRRFLEDNLGNDFSPPVDDLEGAIFQLLSMLKIISLQVQQNPDWEVISHDRLCRRPVNLFQQLSRDLGLGWPPEMERTITQLNQLGTGFDTKRISEMQPDKWKTELSGQEIGLIDKWSEIYGLSDFIEESIL